MALLQAAAYVTDVAWIWCFCGYAMVWASNCSSDLTPRLGTSICCRCSPKKEEKKKKKKEHSDRLGTLKSMLSQGSQGKCTLREGGGGPVPKESATNRLLVSVVGVMRGGQWSRDKGRWGRRTISFKKLALEFQSWLSGNESD